MADDYRAMREGAGAIALAPRTVVRVTGDDRVSFLHGMSSNDIKQATAGTILPALFLTEHAHLIADFLAWIEPDAILLDIDSALWTRARAHLEKLLVADDVEFDELTELAVIDIEGPRAAEAVRTVASDKAAALGEWTFVRAEDLTVGNLPRLGSNAFTIMAPAEKTVSILAQITALGPDFRAVGQGALEIIRVENGLALTGVDTGEKTIALEARLDRAISLRKGCYVGQETIERATARGGMRKRLFGLRIEGTRAPQPGAPVILAAKEVGRVTSVVLSPKFGLIGLAILNQSAWDDASALSIADPAGEIAARTSEIPFQ
ncbi:MAG: glycine cleavage T C-terminal barrel domain-containing protein [Candidatus Binataceae bacterium]